MKQSYGLVVNVLFILVVIALMKSINAFQIQIEQQKSQPAIHNNEFKRRNFMFKLSFLQTSIILGKKQQTFALPLESFDDINLKNLQNYVYNDNWVGTSLPILSLEQAACDTVRNDFVMGRWPDPILRRRASKIDGEILGSSLLMSVANKLRKTARNNRAVGLAAQQCGIDLSLIFLDELKVNQSYRNKSPFSESMTTKNDITESGGIFLCNPRIINRSPEMDMKVWTEECLVLPPTFTATLLRDATVMVQYETLEGLTMNKYFTGELARALQHEMDHDRGILILDHVDLNQMESLKMKEIEKPGHDNRMELAYSRYINAPSEISNNQLPKRNPFIAPANAAEIEGKDNITPPNQYKVPLDKDSNESNAQSNCNEECLAKRKHMIQERRAMMNQSRSNSSRRDVLELSRQRAILYGTEYRGL